MTTIKKRKRAGSKFRRRLSGALALGIALVGAGGLYTVLTPEPQTAHAAADPALVRQGEQLYNNACISCHGANLGGVKDRGPSLVGVGEAAAVLVGCLLLTAVRKAGLDSLIQSGKTSV